MAECLILGRRYICLDLMGLILDLVFGRKLEVIMFVVSDLAVLCGTVKALGNGRFFGGGFRGPGSC